MNAHLLPMKRHRLDSLLVDKGLAPSREKARALIMAGRVFVDGLRIEKPGKEFASEATVRVKGNLPYVSRGGFKLEAALDGFGIDPSGLSILDAGASTGGFTDLLLQRGAAKIIAIDVGYGQFAWRLRQDPRVTVMERTNIRHLDPEQLPFALDGVVADLSFISLRLVLGKFRDVLPRGGWALPLVKPQFEVGRESVGKHGVVRDETKIRQALNSLKECASNSGFLVLGELECPIRGPRGNREFFLSLRKK